jgi:hypothetical protein
LQRDAVRIGRPCGVLCAAVCGTYVAVDLYGPVPGSVADRTDLGPLTVLGVALVVMCATAAAGTAVAEARNAHGRTTAALRSLGASARLLRAAAAARATALLAVLGPLTWLIAELTTLPFAPWRRV